MHDVETGATLQLGVLQAEGGVQLPVGARGVVEDPGEHPQDVVVVVEDLVVGTVGPPVALHEQGVRRVDHDLPDVVVLEERSQGAIADQVAQGPRDDVLVEGHGPPTVSVFGVPPLDGVGHQATEAVEPVGPVEVQGQLVRPFLGQALDGGQGRGRGHSRSSSR